MAIVMDFFERFWTLGRLKTIQAETKLPMSRFYAISVRMYRLRPPGRVNDGNSGVKMDSCHCALRIPH